MASHPPQMKISDLGLANPLPLICDQEFLLQITFLAPAPIVWTAKQEFLLGTGGMRDHVWEM
jgi:hypothetical protein